MTPRLDLVLPDWPAPERVAACSTTRRGGHSRGAFAELNLGDHVGDEPAAVRANRALLREALALPAEPLWLAQVHGTRVVEADRAAAGEHADASFARSPGVVCAVLTADCLPVLLCSTDGDEVAAVHAGWRGLAAGVLERAVEALRTPPGRLLSWIGPGIGPAAYEVGPEVREAFVSSDPGAGAAFSPGPRGRPLVDLPALARRRLRRAGVARVDGGILCTHADPGRFFSHRRDGPTGRLATLVWLRG